MLVAVRKDYLWPAATAMAILLAMSAGVFLRGRRAGTAGGKLEELQELLRQDSSSPYRWCDLGEGLLAAGQTEKARYCFGQAVKLAPNIPPIWMRAAFFHFQVDETEAALDCSARVLKTAPDYDQVVFHYYDQLVHNVGEVLPHLADNRRAAQAFFSHILASGTTQDAGTIWAWMGERGFREDRLASEYVDMLVKRKMAAQAVDAWAGYLGARRGEYPETNLLFNGEFENELTGALFDWRVTPAAGAETTRDGSCVRSGRWSLHISFRGVENMAYGQASQTVYLRPGGYVVQGYARTKELTTDEGIRLHVFDAESGARLDIYTEQVTGTNDWTKMEKRFTVGPGGGLTVVQVCRLASGKFDNKIGGEAWVDGVSLQMVRQENGPPMNHTWPADRPPSMMKRGPENILGRRWTPIHADKHLFFGIFLSA